MPRYIDADKTLDMMWNALYQYEDDMEKKHGLNSTERLDVQNGFEIAHKVVVNAPAEDVEPVVHAHKVRVHSQGGGTHWVVCSHCEKPIDWQDAYCKHCGAIMDEVVE